MGLFAYLTSMLKWLTLLLIGACSSKATTPPLATFSLTTSSVGPGHVLSNVGGIDCGAACQLTAQEGSTVVLFAVPDADAVFSGWSDASCSFAACPVTIDANKTVTATFTSRASAVTKTLTVAPSGAGSVTSLPQGIDCGATCASSFTQGSSVVLLATPAQGQTIGTWSVPGCSGPSCVVVLADNTNTSVSFVPLANGSGQTVNVTVTVSGQGRVTSVPSGIDCGVTCALSVATGTGIGLIAVPDAGWEVSSWSNHCTDALCAIAPVTDTAVTVFFQRKPVTVTLHGTGIGRVSSDGATPLYCRKDFGACSLAAPTGVVTLTASADEGYEFAGWSGACSGTSTCIAPTGGGDIGATFVGIPFQHYDGRLGVFAAGTRGEQAHWYLTFAHAQLFTYFSGHYRPASASADWTRLAILANQALDGSDTYDPTANIWLADVNEDTWTPITRYQNPDLVNVQPSISPDGTKLAYITNVDPADTSAVIAPTNGLTPPLDIWSTEVGNFEPHPATSHATRYHIVTGGTALSWAPSGDRIVFVTNAAEDLVSPGNSSYNIWTAAIPGPSEVALTHFPVAPSGNSGVTGPVQIQATTWSPLGDTIAFWSNLDPADTTGATILPWLNLWTVDVNSGVLTPLTHFTVDMNPYWLTWSPNGTALAFTSTESLTTPDTNGSYTNAWILTVASGVRTAVTSNDSTQSGSANSMFFFRSDPTALFVTQQNSLFGSNVTRLWRFPNTGAPTPFVTGTNYDFSILEQGD